MLWYDAFNLVEALLWAAVAAVILHRAPVATPQQHRAVTLGSTAFILFGLTDALEVGTHGRLPLWLWSAKIGCGSAILAARYHWRGWSTFHWRDREFLFALGCAATVLLIVAAQMSSERVLIGD